METITITLTSRQALAVSDRLIERQQHDKRDMSRWTPSYLEQMADIDAVLRMIQQQAIAKAGE